MIGLLLIGATLGATSGRRQGNNLREMKCRHGKLAHDLDTGNLGDAKDQFLLGIR
jgi:hypothetical protein